MPCTPNKRFPGTWPETRVMRASPRELRAPSPSRSGGAATHLARKPVPLRIIVPPTEYCPFSTDLTLPITPLSLPTPVSSSCFTFSDMQEPASQGVFASPTPALALPPFSQNNAVSDFASPTSSQFLLMPPTPHMGDAAGEAAICVSPLATPAAANESMHSRSKPGSSHPWEVSSSTWLSDLGGHTETDRIFRHHPLEITVAETDSSPASTPALSPSTVSPSSQISSLLAYSVPTCMARSPASLTPALSAHSRTMSPQSSSAHLTLKPTGTDTFPSALDSLQAWRESVTPGIPQLEEPCPLLVEDILDSSTQEAVSETAIYPSTPFPRLQSRPLSPPVLPASKAQTLMKRARMFGGRVKQLITRQSVGRHRGSMDRGVNLRVITTQDSENGSVILIIAPPPPYDVRPSTPVPHSAGLVQARSRTISEYSSVVQASMVEVGTTGLEGPGSRQGSGNRNALRRLSLAAISTIKRF